MKQVMKEYESNSRKGIMGLIVYIAVRLGIVIGGPAFYLVSEPKCQS